MTVVDLTQPLYDHMPVYPGDPEVSIKQVLTLAKDGWNMNLISLPAHIATHVNMPLHAANTGKTLDDYPIEAFFGRTVVFHNLLSIKSGFGVLFKKATIPKDVLQKVIDVKPTFVGVQGYFESESELETERRLLKEDIISYEGLVNVNKLPKDKEVMFYGLPLKIKAGEGSPVRAFAIVK